MHGSRKRRGPTTVAAAALVLAACLGKGAGSASGYPGGGGSGAASPQRPGQPVGAVILDCSLTPERVLVSIDAYSSRIGSNGSFTHCGVFDEIKVFNRYSSLARGTCVQDIRAQDLNCLFR